MLLDESVVLKVILEFIWSQFRKKTTIVSEDKTTITYSQQQTFIFNAEASAPLTDNDNIHVLNIPLNVSAIF